MLRSGQCYLVSRDTGWKGRDVSSIGIQSGRDWVHLSMLSIQAKGGWRRCTSKIEDNPQNYEAYDRKNLDGPKNFVSKMFMFSKQEHTDAKKNSASPYAPAPSMLITMTTLSVIAIQAAGLTLWFQNPTRTDAALSSAGNIMTQLYLTKMEWHAYRTRWICYQ